MAHVRAFRAGGGTGHVTTPPAKARGLLEAFAPETVVPVSKCCRRH
jgi:hypothetical protein